MKSLKNVLAALVFVIAAGLAFAFTPSIGEGDPIYVGPDDRTGTSCDELELCVESSTDDCTVGPGSGNAFYLDASCTGNIYTGSMKSI